MMKHEQVVAAKERAAEVVNGFRCATERNARDALKLAEHVEALNRELRVKDRQIDVTFPYTPTREYVDVK